jgi:ribosomal protein S18 acetylase RimI-like enzyme
VAVIRDGERIAALSILQKTGERTRYIYQVAVSPRYHGRKYMQSIFDFQYAPLPKGTAVSLWVAESNGTIIHIHKKYGYRADPRRYLEILSTK